MSTWTFLLLLCLVVLSTARIVKPPPGRTRQRETVDTYERSYDSDEERSLRSVLNSRRGAFSCIELGDECSGIRPCCGSSVCYWPDGYSIKRNGRCVTCVSNSQACQRDSQCCSGLICHKSTTWATDGSCGPKRARGQECHDNDQCLSEYCDISWLNNVRGHGGYCS